MRVCKAPNCEKILNSKNGPLCQSHTYRMRTYKSYDLPPKKPKRSEDYLMTCKTHGKLTKEQIQFRERKADNFIFIGQNCLECIAVHGIANRYRLTVKEYEMFHVKQKGLCAICKRPETRTSRGKVTRLAVDHCHKSEKENVVKIRGLLCFKCNAALGSFEDNVEFLKNAIEYLR